jgi:hypothetical protein
MSLGGRGTFESVTKVALAEIVRTHGQESKFGLMLSEESIQGLVDDLFDLVLTSRSLKSAGDRFLANGGPPTPSANQRVQRPGGR